jgi:TIR domain-containing protein
MYSITSRRWFFPTILVLLVLCEVFGWRATWRTDTQGDSKLHRLEVRSGYALLLENRAGKEAQPILSYNATPQHNHRLTLDIRSAHLSDESLRLLAMVNPPKTSGRLIFAPDPSETKTVGPSCLAGFRVEFPADAGMQARSVEIAPPQSEDVFDRTTTRMVHLSSHSPLAVRLSANAQDGATGPGCRNLLSIGSWQQVIGKDIELAFIADPAAPIDLTLSSPSFRSGKNEVESLEIEHLLPQRLSTRPLGLTRVIQSRDYAGVPPLTLTDLRLGGDFFDVELAGRAGIPIPELLGWTKWPILALLDLPLLAFCIIPPRKTTFISYSRQDKDRVMPIYERLKQAGLDVWIDRDGIKPGADWEETIRRQMLKARRILIFVSRSLNDGGFILAELGLARAIAKHRAKASNFLIPVRLDDCQIPPILAHLDAMDLFEADGERRLAELLGIRALPDAPPVKAAAMGATGSGV